MKGIFNFVTIKKTFLAYGLCKIRKYQVFQTTTKYKQKIRIIKKNESSTSNFSSCMSQLYASTFETDEGCHGRVIDGCANWIIAGRPGHRHDDGLSWFIAPGIATSHSLLLVLSLFNYFFQNSK